VDATLLARWQFGVTTVYHWLFVPLTLGLSFTVAVMQTMWFRKRDEKYLRMTKYFGKLFLINFALGVATGIVQEFQFGMNWSTYSRYVGDIFGAPLAIEGLLAFFLESTFLGLWIFGWTRLSPKLHLASIWLVTAGTWLSAFWILAANGFMQNPVGYTFNAATGRAELDNFFEVITNKVLLIHWPHTILSGLATAGILVLGVSAWHLLRKNQVEFFTSAASIGAVIALVASLGVAFTGHAQGQIMTEVQPMKMAAAEALWEDEAPAAFSVFAVGDIEQGRNRFNITIPRALSVLATNTLDGEVRGINSLQAEYEETYGPGDYIPNVGVAYWTFRIMIGAGGAMILISAGWIWLQRRGKLLDKRWFLTAALAGIALPYLANSTGWIMTEMGRQPWAVFGLLRVEDGISPQVAAGWVLITLVGFTLVYAALAVVDVYLLRKFAIAGPTGETTAEDVAASMAY
jgi:cytochrome d ubiquinol oxidase subunit I